MTHDQMIAVIQAHKEGRRIQQARPGFRNGEWIDCLFKPHFNFEEYDYRVKPEPPKPREFCLSINGTEAHGHLIREGVPFHSTKHGYILAREVLDAPSVPDGNDEHLADQVTATTDL